ncbi:amino acid ABC transporter ATP-binding protein [Periweissella cryptocerci]|uniref:Amino acid ABC transporter ATP-binding protein n=1 Tax=Periweissella cryptocerci TaxID=2506420 RepID=A0A4P6YST8_9LACO|nr:amino acid ABC transporter ATP-binding protein [Periweissella cryptocerci]QBO35798.1 amino acid ABC transporter ATP-binding protein [Periweissella cryptocerci]
MITIENLAKSYQQNIIFKNFNLEIASGEVVAIIGPSGTGKSTLLRTLNLLEKPDEGRITINNVPVVAPKIKAKEAVLFRQQTATVFQQFNLFSQKTVLENVTEGLILVKHYAKEAAIELAERLLKRVNLLQRKNFYPNQLSGGEKQRVGIARALAMNAPVLLLDEPTSALDSELVGEVLQTIKDVVQQNNAQTVILVSHELEFVRQVATRVIFFANGQIQEDGTPQEIFENPKNPRTVEFLRRFRGITVPVV